jgi:hypothetical protein
MRYILLLTITVSGALHGQAIMDVAAASAGGVAGGAAGKKVSDGLTNIFGKVANQTSQAAGEVKPKSVATVQTPPPTGTTPAAPLLEVGPGVPKSGGVPLPPPNPSKVAMVKPAPAPVPEPVVAPEPPPPPPPPPEVSSDDLRKVAAGMNRDDLLKMGAPASRITMFDDGHLMETYRYAAHGPNGDASLGVVRLVDGSVATVQVN